LIDWVPQLQTTTGGEVSLLFLDTSEILALNKSSDPWFSRTALPEENVTTSHAQSDDVGAGVLGCVTDMSFCGADLPAGTDCVGKSLLNQSDSQDYSILAPIANLLLNKQLEASWTVTNGAPALLAQNTVFGNAQMALLPNGQWQEEREHMYKASMIGLQANVVEYARGYWPAMAVDACKERPCHRMCHSQVRALFVPSRPR